MMKRLPTAGWWAMVCLLAVFGAETPALAGVAPYNIVVKNPAGVTVRGTGGLSFNNNQEASGDGDYPPEASPPPSITFTSGLAPALLPFTFNTIDPLDPLQVAVVSTSCIRDQQTKGGTITGLFDQGPNVEGLRRRMTGTKTVGSATIKLAIDFTLVATPQVPASKGQCTNTYTREYSIKLILPAVEREIATGKYHIFNPASAVPEPGSLALLLTGLAAGAAALRARTRRRG
jgi:hypothetical protein